MRNRERRSLRITFLLPLPGTNPVGGFKVVYEYANYLAKQGHRVSIVHPAIFRIDLPLFRLPLKTALRTVRDYVRKKFNGEFKPASWFAVLPAVRLLWVWSLAARNVPDGDVVIATAWETAEWAQTYPESKGKKFYLIQHLETWSGPEERVFDTWKAPLEKIVIASWLQEIAEGFGQTAHLIHNGLDFERFSLTNPQASRDPHRLLMMFHTVDWKGSADGLAAFEIARKQEPELQLTLFSVVPPPETLPAGVEYFHNPPQKVLRDLYNNASIFVLPSWAEGFPLPPAEALQCGAAIVVTDIGGTKPFAIHEQTALRTPVKDPEAMAATILRLVRDQEFRLRLAQDGHAFIQQFTWEKAGASFEAVLLQSQT
jgi:glycosyltransferase involved in cell wall biosynthesis